MQTYPYRNPRHLVALLFVGLVMGVAGRAAPVHAQSNAAAGPSAEHHLHLQSAELTRIVDAAQRAGGGSPKDAPPLSAPSAADAIEALDSAGVRYGLALSGGYFWGSPFLRSPMLSAILDSLGVQLVDERAKVRAENARLAEQVALYPDRLIGACSVNPLKDYAVEEVEICGTDTRIGAMKLHLANSMMDFSDTTHVARLRTFFQALGKTDLVAVVHVRNRGPGYGAEDTRVFIREVLTAAPNVPVQISHMAGWGFYDDATHSAMQPFVDAFRDGTLNAERITFGVGVLVSDPADAGADTMKARQMREQNARLAERMREVGIDRVVVETDWPFFPPVGEPRTRIARYREQLRSTLPLEPAELDRFFSNVGPMFRK